jgi:hypothetical protein
MAIAVPMGSVSFPGQSEQGSSPHAPSQNV